MLTKILSISGKSGLYSLVSHGKGTLIVESLIDGKRTAVHAKDHVISLKNISMFTYGDDVPLSKVLNRLYEKQEGKQIDVKSLKNKEEIFASFAEVLEDFDQDRVYPSDVKKLYNWYNILVESGLTDFSDRSETEE